MTVQTGNPPKQQRNRHLLKDPIIESLAWAFAQVFCFVRARYVAHFPASHLCRILGANLGPDLGCNLRGNLCTERGSVLDRSAPDELPPPVAASAPASL